MHIKQLSAIWIIGVQVTVTYENPEKEQCRVASFSRIVSLLSVFLEY